MGVSETCEFCSVIAGASGATKLLDDDDAVAFLDVRPVFKGHALVVPRAPHETLTDVPGELVGPLFVAVQRVQRAVIAATGAQGAFVAMNNKVSQSVPHLHVHVVPRTKGDGLRGFFWPRMRYESAEEYEEYASRIRDAIV
jgi:histidine triad (HIT) family protein